MTYYTRDISPPQFLKDPNDFSTADRFVNIEESQRKYQQLIQQNLWLKQQIQRKKIGQNFQPHPVYYKQIHKAVHPGGDRSKNDMILWGMIQRNRYLEQKLAKLKKQQQKQASSIKKIQQSEQWQNRHVCIPEKCYQQKYIQLLRVRSPFF